MSTMTLERKVGKLTFANPLVLGAGTCKTEEDVKHALNTAVAGIEIGSITPKPRPGNTGGALFYAHYVSGVPLYTLNSLGMPNPGKEAVGKWVPDAIALAHDKGKLIGANIAGDSVEEIAVMVLWALELGFDWVTINAGCPNKWVEQNGVLVPASILSFDMENIAELMHFCAERIGATDTEVWWKSSPINDTVEAQPEMWEFVAGCPTITGQVPDNTVPHCFAFNRKAGYRTHEAAIHVGGGYAGMGGPATKPKALGDVGRLRAAHGERFTIVGAGGVTYGEDIVDYLCQEADIVQFTSAWWMSNFDKNLPGGLLARYCELAEIEPD